MKQHFENVFSQIRQLLEYGELSSIGDHVRSYAPSYIRGEHGEHITISIHAHPGHYELLKAKIDGAIILRRDREDDDSVTYSWTVDGRYLAVTVFKHKEQNDG